MRLSGCYDVQSETETRTNAEGYEVRYKRYYINEPERVNAQ